VLPFLREKIKGIDMELRYKEVLAMALDDMEKKIRELFIASNRFNILIKSIEEQLNARIKDKQHGRTNSTSKRKQHKGRKPSNGRKRTGSRGPRRNAGSKKAKARK
jgi:hypothetical protein